MARFFIQAKKRSMQAVAMKIGIPNLTIGDAPSLDP
jgi:hypothetical protein